ncbi:hypothetical protein GCM10011519_15430 [Marmoricola endophyticus]|uniref:Signal peptidase I n=1 Tax=Marmoricola endophyticus TaxID=2040280 RepID=A0A917F3S4_9ACTN|nr:hypothetical protein [Marmoricola endophyticus]GGF42487.1 hypothetical protein GCM10011519_15430 [Marmoricola endophyticus]
MLRSRSTALAVIAALAVGATLLTALVWWSTGGRWYDVRTASMGRTAPVGALLLTRPASADAVQVGDLVTFRQPDSGKVYTHRAVEVSAGGIRTKGDVNPAADPWSIDQAHLVGKVVAVWPAVGWVLRGAPLLLLGLGLVWLVSGLVRASWRSPVRVVGAAVAFAAVCLLMQPWVGLDRVGVTDTVDGPRLEAVSTGVLPVRAQLADEMVSPRMRSGEVARIAVPSDGTRYSVAAVPSLSGWWWVVVAGICLAPLLWTLVVGLAPLAREEEQ